ncbi:hypothetical protein ACVIYH_004553 [Bradyrhizobium diazoefficiens]
MTIAMLGNDKHDVSGAAQRDQIGIVLVRGRERDDRRGQPEQDETDTAEELHDASHARSGECFAPNKAICAAREAKAHLHENCKRLLKPCRR